jgi:hypothetical protein
VSALTVVDGNSNAQNYIEVIDYFVWPVITRHLPDNKYVFQGDNGPILLALITCFRRISVLNIINGNFSPYVANSSFQQLTWGDVLKLSSLLA